MLKLLLFMVSCVITNNFIAVSVNRETGLILVIVRIVISQSALELVGPSVDSDCVSRIVRTLLLLFLAKA